MSYLVLARKWRPQSFKDIAGQEHITRTLQNAIRSNRIAHAYLFTGVRGVGKTTAARILAKALNCEKGPTETPCNDCDRCKEITDGVSLDVLEIDGASNRGIDEIRQIIENVRYQPAKGRYKVYIIDEVHQVTKDAFNALLKTLEEPPPSVKFILATTEPHRLPETILSRCQRYDFRRIALREIVDRLADIAKAEGLKITEGALALLAREADGSMRDAQSLLEQVLAFAQPGDADAGPMTVDEGLLYEVLGLAERQLLYGLSSAVIQGDASRCIELIARVVFDGRDLCRLSRDLLEHFRNLLVARLSEPNRSPGEHSDQSLLLDLPGQEIEDLHRQVAGVSLETLVDYFDFMAAGDESVARSANPRFALESLLVRLATLPKTLPAAELLERLEKLEKKLSGEARSGPGPVRKPAVELSAAVDVSVAPAVARAEPPAADLEATWQNFVAFVGKEKKFLASHLHSATALALPPAELKIGIAERLHLNYLQDAENLTALKDLARRFFSANNVEVSFTPLAADAGSQADAGVAERADSRPMVKEALRIFGGSIKPGRRDDG